MQERNDLVAKVERLEADTADKTTAMSAEAGAIAAAAEAARAELAAAQTVHILPLNLRIQVCLARLHSVAASTQHHHGSICTLVVGFTPTCAGLSKWALSNALIWRSAPKQVAKSSREAAAEAETRAARLEAKTRLQAEDLEAAAEKLSARSATSHMMRLNR